MRRIFGTNKDATLDWRRLHSEEFYHSPTIVRVIQSRRLRMSDNVARMEEGRSAFKMLTGIPTGKRPLGMPRHRREGNIRMYLKQNRYQYEELAQDTDYWRAPVHAAIMPR